MKMKKLFAVVSALAMSAALLSLAACKDPTPPIDPIDPDTPVDPDPPVVQTTYGLPVAERGHFIKDADLLQDGETRWLLYTANETSGEEDNAIAVRKGAFEQGEDKGWTYGAEKIVLRGGEGEWDEYIGSASLVKGTFTLGETSYGWLMAYCGTSMSNDTQYQIGLAVANSPDGEWTKVAQTPFIEFDAKVYGASSVGNYAPSLINLDKTSAIRLFYTYADAYGHFAKFTDFDASNLDELVPEQAWQGNNVTNVGEVEGGDDVAMFPNSDFAYDATAGKFYAVKDRSPSAATKPNYATSIQLLFLAENELYTVEDGNGWKNVRSWDNTDTPDAAFERLYGACIVADAYGHIDGASAMEIVYNVCELEMDNEDWLFTQNLQTFNVTLS